MKDIKEKDKLEKRLLEVSSQTRREEPIKNLFFFAKIVDDFQPLTIFTKSSILDVWQGPEYVSSFYITFKSFRINSFVEYSRGGCSRLK